MECTWQHSRLHLGTAVHGDELEQILRRFRLRIEGRVEQGQHRAGQLQKTNKQVKPQACRRTYPLRTCKTILTMA